MIFGKGLIQVDDVREGSPAIVDRIIYDSDRAEKRFWRIVLNRNIVYHDGRFMLNSDVKFTFDLVKKYGGYILNRRLDFSNIKEISLAGDLEVKFELYKPDPNFYNKLIEIPIISRNYYIDALKNGYSVFDDKPPMGCGPFAFVFQNDTALNIKIHPNFYAGHPFLEYIRIDFFEDEGQLTDAFTNRSVDFIEVPDRITAQTLNALLGNNAIVFTIPRPEIKVYFILINNRKFPLSELSVRRGIDYAINREEIIEKFHYKEIANTLINLKNPHYFKTAFREIYDPGRALQLLKSAGWQPNRQTGILEKNGQFLDLNLYFSRNSFLEESIARAVKISLGELNINIQPVPIIPSEKKKRHLKGEYDLMIWSYSYDSDYLLEAIEQFYFDILKGSLSNPNYQNTFLDQLLNLSYRDSKTKNRLFQRFQFYVKREVPAIFLFFDDRIIVAVNSRFHNFRTTYRDGDRSFYRLRPIEDWFVPEILQKYSTESDRLSR